uniref:Uncharacterized protein n=1 Tax=Romanomermis culicivorax TaxID=13658 RepID=A0A915K4R3_ROMCU
MFCYPEHARRANFLCSGFRSPSKYLCAEHAWRGACSTLCSPNIFEHAGRACSPSNEQKYEPGLRNVSMYTQKLHMLQCDLGRTGYSYITLFAMGYPTLYKRSRSVRCGHFGAGQFDASHFGACHYIISYAKTK